MTQTVTTITAHLPPIFDQPELAETAAAIRGFLTVASNNDADAARDVHQKYLRETIERYEDHIRHLQGHRPPVDGVGYADAEARLIVATIQSVLEEGGFAIYLRKFSHPLPQSMDFREGAAHPQVEVLALLKPSQPKPLERALRFPSLTPAR